LPATIRIAPVGIVGVSAGVPFCAAFQSFLFYAPIARSILTPWTAPAVIIRFAFRPLEVCAAFGVGHCPARGGCKDEHEY
jgi:hypothetical protein